MRAYLRRVWERIPLQERFGLMVGLVGWVWLAIHDPKLALALMLIMWSNNLMQH